MIRKVLTGLLGMVVVLTWWTIRGNHGHREELLETIPTKVWDGGGGTIAIDVDATTTATLRIEFHERHDGGRDLTVRETVGPGPHSWSVEVPRNAGGYIDFQADAPHPGAKLSWTLRHDGQRIASDAQTLQKPLGQNEGFGLQEHYHDYSRPDVRGSDSSDNDDK